MIDQLAISIAQLNPTVGDIAGNVAKLRRALAEAAEQSADLVVGTELCVAGYPPEDLVLKPAFVAACQAAVRDFARETTSGPAIIVGTPWRQDGKLYNAAALLDRGQVAALRFKSCPITASSTKSASSRPVRRPAPSPFAACASAS